MKTAGIILAVAIGGAALVYAAYKLSNINVDVGVKNPLGTILAGGATALGGILGGGKHSTDTGSASTNSGADQSSSDDGGIVGDSNAQDASDIGD